MDWRSKLNDPQYEALRHEGGPLLVLAGAGSGKTRVIIYRIAWLIAEKGVSPREIVALTFTNKAAAEMKHRAVRLLDELGFSIDKSELNVSTFHSFGARLLRENAQTVGLDWNFDIYDRDDQIALVKQILDESEHSSSKAEAKIRLGYIQDMKNKGKTPTQAHEDALRDEEEQNAFIYESYQKQLLDLNSADFGDLLLSVVDCFRAYPALANHYSRRWSHLLVDEFQDTNPVQYQLLQHLTSEHDNLMVVGDDDQSIYQWRGATVENILDFESDYPDAESVSLEQNYRSTGRILKAANDVIAQNDDRRDKRLWTSRGDGPKILYYTASDGGDEATYVARKIERMRRHESSDVGVIYRTNAQGRHFEEELRRRSIPYIVRGGTSFYERAEIKDALAYLRAVVNPANAIAWGRIINRPKRGIGKVTQQKLNSAFGVEGVQRFWDVIDCAASGSLRDALEQTIDFDSLTESDRDKLEAVSNLGGRPAGGLKEFRQKMVKLREQLEGDKPVSEALKAHLRRVGYFEYLEKQYPESELDRRGHIFELLEAIDDFAGDYTPDEKNQEEDSVPAGIQRANAFLQEATLTRDADHDETNAPVSLMTAHSAKGLEFESVFVVGLEDRFFPHQRQSESGRLERDKIAEERRLFYVALTRAKTHLYLTNAKTRRVYGKTRRTEPSRFLLDIDPEYLTVDAESTSSKIEYRESRTRQGWKTTGSSDFEYGVSQFPDYEPENKPKEASRNFASGGPQLEDEQIEGNQLVDATVSHSKFGIGTVKSVSGSGEEALLRIEFPTSGEKTVVRRFVKVYG